MTREKRLALHGWCIHDTTSEIAGAHGAGVERPNRASVDVVRIPAREAKAE